jgi:DNA-binding beta-propeller fold protein YncE
MRLGGGTRTYEVVEGWAKLPDGTSTGYTHGVATDSVDRVYVHNQSKNAIIVFDRDGDYLNSWGADFQEGAHGMRLYKQGGQEFLYFADYAKHRVVKTTLDGDVVFELGPPPMPEVYPDADAYRPTEVCVAPNGNIYVGDGYGRSYVHQYGPDAKWIRSWGGEGSEPGRLKCPHGVCIDTRRDPAVLLVADRGNGRIQIFTLDGEHIGFVTDELRQPCGFFLAGEDVVIPDLHGRVTILDKNNRLIAHLGDNPGIWDRPGWPNVPSDEIRTGVFNSPHAACVDSHGDLYIVEWISHGRITKLRRV